MKVDIESGLAIDPVQVNMLTDMEQQNKAFQPELQSAEADAAAEREIKKLKSAPPKQNNNSNKQFVLNN